VLSAGALRSEGVDADLVPVQLDLDVVLGLGHDLHQRECRVATLLRVVGADPDEAVDAALGAQPAVGEPPGDRGRGALEARLLALGLVDDLGREAVPLRPAQVHPQQHLGPVRRLGSARAGADREERRPLVVLATEQQEGALALVLGGDRLEVAVELG